MADDASWHFRQGKGATNEHLQLGQRHRGYTGAKDGSAEMNMWLHKAVMKKMAENGGKVPAELMD